MVTDTEFEDVRRVLDFSYLELLQKTVRLRDYIQRKAEEIPDGSSQVLVTDSLQALTDNLRSQHRDIARYSASSSTREELSRLLLLCRANYQKRVSEFLTTHSRLGHFPTEWSPEVLGVFLSAVASRASFVDEDFKALVTIALSSAYHFAEYDRAIYDPNPPGSDSVLAERLIFLPLAERDNPMAWPLLVHEVGHRVVEHFDLADSATEILERLGGNTSTHSQTRNEQRAMRSWAIEIAADLFAIDLLGPAYFASFINTVVTMIMQDLNVPTATHPPPALRVKYMRERLMANGVLIDNSFDVGDLCDYEKLFDARRTVDTLARLNLQHNGLHFGGDSVLFADTIAAAARAITASTKYSAIVSRKFDKRDCKDSIPLTAQLVKKRPIAGRRAGNNPPGLDDSSVRSGVAAYVAGLNELPVDPACIVTAAAMHEIHRLQTETHERALIVLNRDMDFAAKKGDPDSFTKSPHWEEYAELDQLIAKSIELSRIISFYVEK